jgi:hypothetical protein
MNLNISSEKSVFTLEDINSEISKLVCQKVDIDRKICSLETMRYELKQNLQRWRS